MLARAVATWVAMIPVAIVNGVVREVAVKPVTGELAAHQISVATGSAAMFSAVYGLWHREADRIGDRSLVRMGGAWMVGTTLFEFALGASRGMSAHEMLQDYNVTAGRLWPVVLATIALSPIATKRLASWRRDHARLNSVTA